MIELKNLHETFTETIKKMLIDTKYSLPYYGNFNLFINFYENKNMPTAGVNMSAKGMNFYYNPEFVSGLSQREANFLMLHEDFHLLWDHPKRTISGQYDHKLSNIAQDMIINHIIWEDINHNFVEIPKNEKGQNMALFIPKEYTGKLIFEEVYEWLRDKKEEHDKKQKCQSQCSSCNGTGKKDQQKQDGDEQGDGQKSQNQQGQGKQDPNGEQNGDQNQQGKSDQQGQGDGQDGQEDCPDCNGSGQNQDQDSSGKPSYGPYGKDPKNESGSIDTYSLDQIFDNLESNNGEYLDSHMNDEVPEEMRESIIKEAIDRLQARGLEAGNIEASLNKLRKKKKDYLKYIKRCIANELFGTRKTKTIAKPNRRGIFGVKGVRKIKTKINVILDVSGSMSGLIERVLDYVYKNDVEITLIEADTQVNFVKNYKKTRGLESLPIHGMGGTVMQPAIDYVIENLNEYPTLLLTDGYCDTLDTSRLKKPCLMISIGTEVPIYKTNGKTKQILVDPEK